MDILGVVTARNFEILASGCARTDENCVEAVVEQVLHAVDTVIHLQVDTHIENVANLFIKHFGRQAELRDVGPHQTTGLLEGFEDGDFITERCEIIGNRQ